MGAEAMEILYSFRRCPYAMRARSALLVSGARFELREVVLRDKPAEMIALSPKGTVPVLALADGRVIDQSIDIMRWALAHQDPEAWLERNDPDLIAGFDDRFKHHLDRYKYFDRYGVDRDMHRVAGLAMLVDLDRRLVDTLNLYGATRGIADMAIFPFVRQFAAVDPAWWAEAPVPHVRAWLARHVASPLFDRCMTRLEPWAPGDDPVVW